MHVQHTQKKLTNKHLKLNLVAAAGLLFFPFCRLEIVVVDAAAFIRHITSSLAMCLMATVITGVTLSLRTFPPIQCQIPVIFGDSFVQGQVTENGDCPRKLGTSGQLKVGSATVVSLH